MITYEVSIKSGTVVDIFAIRCDGREECFRGIDEEGCGLDTGISIVIGKWTFVFPTLRLPYSVYDTTKKQCNTKDSCPVKL